MTISSALPRIPRLPKHVSGTTLIEILVAILIVAIGLLGMAAMQARSMSFEFEAYQRAQALLLMQDMIDRMNGNAIAFTGLSSYEVTVGTGDSDSACAGTRLQTDLCEWSKALRGAAETNTDTGDKKGAMIDGRGCIQQLDTSTFMVSVVWQGLSDTVPPVTTCGQNSYSSENQRRAVTAIVTIPDLGAS